MIDKILQANVERWKDIFGAGGPRNTFPHSYVVSWYFGQVHAGMSGKRDKKVLDIGCGSAADLWLFADNGFHYQGLDVDTFCFEQIKQVSAERDIPESSYSLGVFTPPALPFEDQSFDLVVGLESIHFNATPEAMSRMVADIHRVLRPGGAFLFTVIDPEHYFVVTEYSRFVGENCLEILPGFPEPRRVGLRYWVFKNASEIESLFAQFSKVKVGRYLLDVGDGCPDSYHVIFGSK